MKLRRCDKIILELLVASPDDGTRGLHIVQRSEGKLWRANIYFNLVRLEEHGLVASRSTPPLWQDRDEGPRLYSITDKGKRKLASYVPPKSVWSELADICRDLANRRVAN